MLFELHKFRLLKHELKTKCYIFVERLWPSALRLLLLYVLLAALGVYINHPNSHAVLPPFISQYYGLALVVKIFAAF